ncbi:MAG: HAMP domain-containing protein, partial [Deltaproteobacteria bacterium]|nr:HAMP domain-containing protein [Deltaproteobacteria bacterium]
MPSRAEETRHLEGELAVWRRPSRSLPTRISFLVLAATLVISLTVTGISLWSIDAFLREKIEQKFPSILSHASQTLELWYVQRIHDIGEVSRSPILRENSEKRYSGASAERATLARLELGRYLDDVLRGRAQYRALFLMGPEGEIDLWIGEKIELPGSMRERIADPTTVTVSDVWGSGERRLQVVSVRIDTQGSKGASLHAVLKLDELDRILSSQSLASSERVSLVGPEGRYLASTSGEILGKTYGHDLPEPDQKPVFSDHTKANGERVVSSAARHPRFGWTLVVEEPHKAAFAPAKSALRVTLGINLAIVGALSLIAFRVSVNMVRPIEDLSQAVRRIAEGRSGVVIPRVERRDEVGVLNSAFREMTTRLAANAREIEAANKNLRAKNDELKCMNETLEQLSITDGLTCLHNHRFFQDY